MSQQRRTSLPGASELFRTTSSTSELLPPAQPIEPNSTGAPTGRRRHEEKITVYCSGDELIAIERARLALRAEHGLGVDRGRIVREALAVVLSDLEVNGAESELVRRLRGQ